MLRNKNLVRSLLVLFILFGLCLFAQHSTAYAANGSGNDSQDYFDSNLIDTVAGLSSNVTYSWINMAEIQAIVTQPGGKTTTETFTNSNSTAALNAANLLDAVNNLDPGDFSYNGGNSGQHEVFQSGNTCTDLSSDSSNGSVNQSQIKFSLSGDPQTGNTGSVDISYAEKANVSWWYEPFVKVSPGTPVSLSEDNYGFCNDYTNSSDHPISISDKKEDGIRASNILYSYNPGSLGNASIGYVIDKLGTNNIAGETYLQCFDDPNVYVLSSSCSSATSGSCDQLITVDSDGDIYYWPLLALNSGALNNLLGNNVTVATETSSDGITGTTHYNIVSCNFQPLNIQGLGLPAAYDSNGNQGGGILSNPLSGSFSEGYSSGYEPQDELLLDFANDYQTYGASNSYYNAKTGAIRIFVPGLKYIPYNPSDPSAPISISAAGSTANPGGNNSSGSQNNGNSCQSNGGGFAWFSCEVINEIYTTESYIEGHIIKPLLATKPFNFNAGNSCSPSTNCIDASAGSSVDKVWSDFRIYGNILLVIGLLIVVYAETIGGGVSDAYAAKKIVPRLLIVAILINLSIYIVAGLEDVFNVLGTGITDLITGPFKAANIDITVGGGTFSLLLAGGAGGLALLAFTPGAVVIVLLTLLSLFVAVIGVLATLIFRQGLLMVLLLTSPIAFALYLLPNTEQYFKKWWSLLIKTLMIYPIVGVLFGVAYVAAAVVSYFNFQPPLIAQMMAIIAAVLPLFLIPFAFKIGGGLVGSFNNLASNLSNKVREPIKNARKRYRQKAWQKAKDQGYSRGYGRRVYNRIGRGAEAGWKGRYGFGARGDAAESINTMAGIERSIKENPRLTALARSDDNATAVLALSTTAAEGRQVATELFDDGTDEGRRRAEAAFTAASAVGFSRQNAAAMLQLMAQNKSRAIRAGDYATIQRGINRVFGEGTAAAESAAQSYQYFSREAGRGDLGGVWNIEGVQQNAEALMAQNIPDMTPQQAMQHAITMDAMRRTGAVDMVRGHSSQLRQYADTITTMMNYGNDRQRVDAAVKLLELQKSMSYATDENREIINNLLTGGANPDEGYVSYTDDRTIEDQLADTVNTISRNSRRRDSDAETLHVSGLELSRQARVFDQQTGRSPGGPGDVNQTQQRSNNEEQ